MGFSTEVVQEQPKEDAQIKLRALYMYNFATLIDWPKEYKQGDFLIGIVNENNLFEEMVAKYSNKMIGSQPIRIKRFNSASEITQCHIIYLPADVSDKTVEVAKKYRSKSTLVVTEKEGKLKDGATINLIIRNNKLTYEISKGNANKSKLIVGSKLETLAFKVE
jgi:hypothetical protein